ncbi:HvfC/BufC N-terminal domain-containing protein [Schleiferia thermophila]|jgi:hypothetical protein|uniref:Uncharacterized protein n=1 Tax=Schleiferia thermophila TaxID=884107 RepID=A0A369A386_9FLAO|nr:putative DNA-binding domain-containing protein [Schleiferia thermophila]PMB22746.1 hypothetical protein CEN47_19500 [Fischerella thermalis CCMEE 5319]RCX03613.1 hypothetical protein DES35_10262 [Schleiferia thermophila]GCD79848.1 hypothetical protein JCM30197_10950 [Schleiferia thermophila]
MYLKEKTKRQQSLLAQFTRTGDQTIITHLDGIKVQGIRYYRELIFNIIYDGISNAYPITTNFLSERVMMNLTHQFFSHFKCQTPQVWAMPKEFMDYIIQNQTKLCLKYPFLSDLLLFEWAEIEMFMMPDQPFPNFSEKGNIATDKVVLNPEIQVLYFQYPVHILHPRKIKKKHKGEYFLLAYRHPESKQVIFTELNRFAYLIIEALHQRPLSIEELLKKFFNSYSENEEAIVHFIKQAYENKIILGFAK